MSRAIKVEDQVYDDLDQLRGKGETFSQVIEGFLEARSKILALIPDMEGALKYRQWQEDQIRNLSRAAAAMDS